MSNKFQESLKSLIEEKKKKKSGEGEKNKEEIIGPAEVLPEPIKIDEDKLNCPHCHALLDKDGVCRVLSCEGYGKRFASPSEIKKPEKGIQSPPEKTKEGSEKLSEDEQSKIDSFLRNINFVLRMANLNINSPLIDIQKNLIEPKFKDIISERIKKESGIFDDDYNKETKYINELKDKLPEPIKKFLADSVDERFEKEITEEEKRTKLKDVGKLLAIEIFNELKIPIEKIRELSDKILKEDSGNPLNKIKELSSEIESIGNMDKAGIVSATEKTIKDRISKENIYDLDKIKLLLFEITPKYVYELLDGITFLNNRKNSENMDYIKVRSKELADKPKELRILVEKKYMEIDYRNKENNIVGDMIKLFPEVAKKVFAEISNERP